MLKSEEMAPMLKVSILLYVHCKWYLVDFSYMILKPFVLLTKLTHKTTHSQNFRMLFLCLVQYYLTVLQLSNGRTIT